MIVGAFGTDPSGGGLGSATAAVDGLVLSADAAGSDGTWLTFDAWNNFKQSQKSLGSYKIFAAGQNGAAQDARRGLPGRA